MADEKIAVLKITTTTGDVFFTKETDRTKFIRDDVRMIEDAQMTEEQYRALPATEGATSFFAGPRKAARAPEKTE